jgi:hypothetical protein
MWRSAMFLSVFVTRAKLIVGVGSRLFDVLVPRGSKLVSVDLHVAGPQSSTYIINNNKDIFSGSSNTKNQKNLLLLENMLR